MICAFPGPSAAADEGSPPHRLRPVCGDPGPGGTRPSSLDTVFHGQLDFSPAGQRGLYPGLEPVINFPTGGAGSQFFSAQEARSDEYGVSSSDERR